MCYINRFFKVFNKLFLFHLIRVLLVIFRNLNQQVYILFCSFLWFFYILWFWLFLLIKLRNLPFFPFYRQLIHYSYISVHGLLFKFFFKFIYFYFYFGCDGSSLLRPGFLSLRWAEGYSSLQCTGFSLRGLLLLWSTGSRRTGFSSCGAWALERRLSSCGTGA